VFRFRAPFFPSRLFRLARPAPGFDGLTRSTFECYQTANFKELLIMKSTPFFAVLLLVFSLMSGFAHAEPAAININTATVETLAALDGVGETRAQAIVAYRSENGPFQCEKDLVKVKGIGERTLEKNLEQLTVE